MNKDTLDKYIDIILEDNENVVGEIYLIINTITDMKYVGQTLSHHLNHGKYRPYGYIRRFNTHKSEAKSNPEKQNYLKISMRKDGIENFKVSLICRCLCDEMDNLEQFYIEKYNTLYPDGYNLTIGGKNCIYVPHDIEESTGFKYTHERRETQTEETKKKISIAIKKHLNTDTSKKRLTDNAIDQHMENRLELFKGIKIKPDNIDKYVHTKQNYGKTRYFIKIEGKTTTFYSKTESDEIVKERAYKFLNSLIE